MSVGTATPSIVRAMLDQARRKNYPSGVLGVRARPRWEGPETFTHEDVPVRVVPCVSTLAVREALLDHTDGTWLVVLTDRDDDDLGTGVLSHLVWHRLRTPDPWEAVGLRFSASGIDSRLVTGSAPRDLATGLLAAAPSDGWPPAPGGVLTRDHALGAVARHHLGAGAREADIDALAVLAWTGDPRSAARVADLRALAGDALTDAVIDWVAGRVGSASGPLTSLLRTGQLADVLPLGVVARVLTDRRVGSDGELDRVAREAAIRLEPRLNGSAPARSELTTWGHLSATAIENMLDTPVSRSRGERLLARADTLLDELHAGVLAEVSELVRSGLTERLRRLAATTTIVLRRPPADSAEPALDGEALAEIERLWETVADHRLADDDPRVPPFRASVRLLRWLSHATPPTRQSLPGLLARHRDVDGWVDSAVNDVAAGAGDPELGEALAAVLGATRLRREVHDREFGAALAAHTVGSAAAEEVLGLENVLSEAVLPLARQTPVLLLVLDGCSVAVGAEVVNSVVGYGTHGWVEALLPGHDRRGAALAVLPTLTALSRTSLLCGQLRAGAQPEERAGFTDVARAFGLSGSALFHKKPLDSSRPGFAVADDVGAALDDVDGIPLVGCVLNTIDDALDRSDPGGTDWNLDVVKHLRPLLERAQRAGRTVVLTSDHGHVVERRETTQRAHAEISSARSRSAGQAGDGEVLVEGDRVLEHGGRAVLAVDERLRYGPLKAGYHGGASPAEAVVPLCVLVPGTVPAGSGLTLAGPQEPDWWTGPVPAAAVRAGEPEPPATLFDLGAPRVAGGDTETSPGATLAAAVAHSSAFAKQRDLAGRGLSPEQAEALLAALLDAPGRRLAPAAAARATGLPVRRVRGAIAAAQRLLNVDGYPVLQLDVDGQSPVLDEALLREQFEIRR